MAVPFEQMPLPKIVTKDGSFAYQMTAADMLMLARALNGEEGPSGAPRLAWCYVQRFVMNHANHESFADMVVNHSQVINPRWASDGVHCRPGGAYYGEPECRGAENRNYNRTRPWTSLRSGLQDQLFAWASGRIANPVPKGSDFASASLVARKIAGRNPEGFAVVYQGIPEVTNSVVSTARSRRWSSNDYVRIEVNGRVVGVDPNYHVRAVAGPLSLLGLAAGAWAAWSARRG